MGSLMQLVVILSFFAVVIAFAFAGNGNRFRNEGGDAFDEDDDADEEQSRLDELHPDDGLIVFHFTEPFYPALYEMDEIFPHKIRYP